MIHSKDHFNLRQMTGSMCLSVCIMLICTLMIDVSRNVSVHAIFVDISLPLAWTGEVWIYDKE